MPTSDLPVGATPINETDLTPAELSELHSLPAGAIPVDPVAAFDPKELSELQVHGLFDPLDWANKNQKRAFEPDTLKKLSDAHDIVTHRGFGGFVLGDIAAVKSLGEGKPLEAAGNIFGPVVDTAKHIAKWFGNTIITTPGKVIGAGLNAAFGDDPAYTTQLLNEAAKSSGETVAGVESAMFGLANTGKKVGRLFSGEGYVADDAANDEAKKQRFLSDLGSHQQKEAIGAGQGEFAKTEGTSAEELAKIGVVLDPSVIAERAAGDPFSFYAFGKVFQAITPAGKVLATIPAVGDLGAAASALTSKGLTWAAEKGVDLAGKAVGAAGSVTGAASKVAPVAGAITGAVKGGPLGALAGLKAGEIATRTLAKTAEGLKTAGAAISEFGTKLSTEAGPIGSYPQIARDIIAAAPAALADVAKGAGVDFGFAAATSETPQETEAAATFGTTFGALHGLAGVGRQVVQGQALGARPWGTTQKTPAYGKFAGLDAAHAQAEQSRTPGEVQRANAIRAFASHFSEGVQAYLMPDSSHFEQFLIDQYTKEQGAAPTGQALADIKSNSLSQGMFSAEVTDDFGQKRKVVVLNNVDAAPHEAAHAIQDVIGDSANKVVDALVRDSYSATWESEGERYAARLEGGTRSGTPWRDVIKTRTKWQDADVYLARELGAENFDIAFKNKGGDFGRGDTLPEKLSRIAVKTAVFFGGDPYKGAKTQGLEIQPKADVIEAVKGQAELAKQPTPAAPAPPLVTPKAAAPAPAAPAPAAPAPAAPAPAAPAPAAPAPAAPAPTVGPSADATAAQKWASDSNDPRLVKVVNTIVANQGRAKAGEAAPVRLKYLSVAGEEGSTRSPRRSEQEEAYLKEALGAMPEETRNLVDKTHAHVRFETVKKGTETQSIGYSLEKLVENAQRTAKWLAGNEPARALSPYEVDPASGSFTPDAWKSLVDDVQTYTQNQQAGGTGAGKELVLPKDAAKLGVSTPPVQAAKLAPLEQSKSDFINTLMGFKLPDTTRVSRAGGTPGNLVGQEISKANEQPFIAPRISEPAVPRAGGKEFPGFPGRSIKEVNPLRRSLEAAGFPVNQLTEVVERVNLKHLESVTPAGEVKFRPGVTDTIRAGFLPAEIDLVDKTQDVSALSKSWEGGQTGESFRIGAEITSQEGVSKLRELEKKWVDVGMTARKTRDYATMVQAGVKSQFFREAREAATGEGGAVDFIRKSNPDYQPPVPHEDFGTTFITRGPQEQINAAAALTTETFRDWAKQQKGGFTTSAMKLGDAAAKDPALIFKLREQQDAAQARFKDAEKAEDFDAMMLASTQAQFFREANESATNTGSIGDYKKGEQGPIGQYMPNGEKVEKAALRLHDGQIFTGMFHGAAMQAAQEAGAIPKEGSVSMLYPAFVKDEGFLTDKGTFLSRKEAADLSIANKQSKPGTANHRLAESGRLESHTFQEERSFLPNAEVKDVADEYAKSVGLTPAPFKPAAVNEDLGKKLADFYDEAKHSPNDPAVQKSYKALADETLAQYKAMTDAGYTIEPFDGKGEPYKSSAEMAADVQDNKHLFFLRTEGNFSGKDNPLLEPSGVSINGSELAVNDVFRAIHDFFGHAAEGTQFGPKGEFNAWRIHSEMYSPEAQGALAAETLAQNSFVNFGKHLRDAAGKIPAKGEPGYVAPADRRFAEQKNVVVPSDLINEAKTQFSPKANEDPYAKYNEAYDKAVAKRAAKGPSGGLTGWVLPNNKFVPLTQAYHERYLAENRDELNKEFGTNFAVEEDVRQRQDAVNAGFVRMRLEGSTLHVEAGQDKWTKAARDKVFEKVADRLDDIDKIQVSLLDKDGIVKRHGSERLMDYDTDAEKLDHLPLISEGKSQFSPAETPNLPGVDVGREFDREAIKNMTRAELRVHFPEAIVTRGIGDKVDSEITKSPLSKKAGDRPKAVDAFADKLVEFYNEVKDDPEAKAGSEWYSKFTPLLKKEFGKHSQIMGELLAATSPQTNPQVNFGYAFDALEGYKEGKYDPMLKKFTEGVQGLEDGSTKKFYEDSVESGEVNNPPSKPSDATYLAHWIDTHNLVPLGASGKRFGMHSLPVLQVLTRTWLNSSRGPKTLNFVRNLLGTGDEATIDLWADRTMRRIGYSDSGKRWRILPENGASVSDEDFSFGQDVFRAAADKLSMKPSALQGALWFAEKKYWSDRGWGRLDFGDYRSELENIKGHRNSRLQKAKALTGPSDTQDTFDLTIAPRKGSVGR